MFCRVASLAAEKRFDTPPPQFKSNMHVISDSSFFFSKSTQPVHGMTCSIYVHITLHSPPFNIVNLPSSTLTIISFPPSRTLTLLLITPIPPTGLDHLDYTTTCFTPSPTAHLFVHALQNAIAPCPCRHVPRTFMKKKIL
jgi:hypothetical protein